MVAAIGSPEHSLPVRRNKPARKLAILIDYTIPLDSLDSSPIESDDRTTAWPIAAGQEPEGLQVHSSTTTAWILDSPGFKSETRGILHWYKNKRSMT
jgi:hypothetical protein